MRHLRLDGIEVLGLRAVASTLFLAHSLPLLAQDPTPPTEDGPPPRESRSTPLLEYLDRDGDGSVGRYEGAEAWLHLVDLADGDQDGVLSGVELEAFFDERQMEEREDVRSWIAALDRDDNGGLEARELQPWVRESIVGGFEGADRDGDGSLSFDELLELELDDPMEDLESEILGFLAEVDADGDGAFTLGELPDDLPKDELEELTHFHRELDRDGDGRATKAELRAFAASESMDAEFEVRGQRAHMRGVIGPTTPARVLELLLEHPEVTTIVLDDVPGSMDDEANLRASRLVRRAGLATLVPGDGTVASGGTDFFLAGAVRRAPEGARLGVHSWGGPTGPGNEQPRDDPSHRLYLDYYRAMGVPGEFYWFTLEAAPQESIHWMTPQEIDRYGLLTEVPPEFGDTEFGDTEPESIEPKTIDPSIDGTVERSLPGVDSSYGLDDLDTGTGPRGIVPLPPSVHPTLRKVFEHYTRVTTRTGRPLHILAQGAWTDDQIVHVRKVLTHYLEDVPGSRFGADKGPLGEAMANRRATMVLFDDEPAMERAFDGPLGELHLGMQDLRANECPAPGTPDYMTHGTRDATFEEVLHLVHDYGIRPALPEYDRLLQAGNDAAAQADLWDPWPRDEPDSHRNEYIAAVYDNYLDLWTTPPTVYEGELIEPGDIPRGTSHGGPPTSAPTARGAEAPSRSGTPSASSSWRCSSPPPWNTRSSSPSTSWADSRWDPKPRVPWPTSPDTCGTCAPGGPARST